MADAAQEFLDKQLSKNRFTAKQQARLDASGGASTAGYGDGIVPGGAAYAKYGKMPGTDTKAKDSSSDSPAAAAVGGGLTKDYGSLQDLGFSDQEVDEIKNYASNLSDDAGGFGYTADTEQHFKETQDATTAGSMEAKMRKIGKHMGYEHWGTANPERIKNYIAEQGAKGVEEATEEPERTPIEHSPEIKQATERVRAYEDNVMSGKTSQNLFGDYYKDSGLQLDSKPSDVSKEYEAETNAGYRGVGTPEQAEPTSKAATYSFLDNKKSDLKKKMNFTPV